MSLVNDYGLISPPRALSILVLSFEDTTGNKAMDVLHIQKVIRYYEELAHKAVIDYSNYNLGAVSYELQENLEALEEFGLVEQNGQRHFQLTAEGETASAELRILQTKGDLYKLDFAKKRLNDLPSDELMFFMYNILPESRKNSTEWPRLQSKKVALTKSLYEKGRIERHAVLKWLGSSLSREMLKKGPNAKDSGVAKQDSELTGAQIESLVSTIGSKHDLSSATVNEISTSIENELNTRVKASPGGKMAIKAASLGILGGILDAAEAISEKADES